MKLCIHNNNEGTNKFTKHIVQLAFISYENFSMLMPLILPALYLRIVLPAKIQWKHLCRQVKFVRLNIHTNFTNIIDISSGQSCC